MVDVAQGNINALLASPDREARRTAWESYADAHLALKNTMASCLATGVKQHVFTARARRYISALEAALSNAYPLEVFHNLIDTFRRHLPTWHRYWQVRRQHSATTSCTRLRHQSAADWQNARRQLHAGSGLDWRGHLPLGEEYVSTLRDDQTALGRCVPRSGQAHGRVLAWRAWHIRSFS